MGISTVVIREWAYFLEEEKIISIKYKFSKTILMKRKLSNKEIKQKKKLKKYPKKEKRSFKYILFFHHDMKYEDMLKKGRKKIPKSVLDVERFVIPNIRGHIQGNKTILSNFFQIADTLGRKPETILKYIFKELGTPGEIKKALVILGRKISAKKINEKINEFAKKFVICNVCGKPETKLTKKNRIRFIKCNACGARYPVN